MLDIPVIASTSKNQMRFQRLRLVINNYFRPCVSVGYRGPAAVDDWKNVFSCVHRLYPNLKEIIYETQRSFTTQFQGILSEELDWTFCFGNLEVLKLDIPLSTDNATAIMDAAHSRDNFRALRALQLKTPCPFTRIVHEDPAKSKNRYGYELVRINVLKCQHFLDKVDAFLCNRPELLVSFVLHITTDSYVDNVTLKHETYIHTYWPLWTKVVSIILKLSQSENNGGVFDGFLEFSLPLFGFDWLWNQYRHSFRAKPTAKVEHEWIVRSKRIGQMLCNIQMNMSKVNAFGEEKKLSVKLMDLRLYEEHNEFLKFWFTSNELFSSEWQDRNRSSKWQYSDYPFMIKGCRFIAM